MLSVGSLFAGIGGFDLGFERVGMHTRWQVEQSEFCRAVLAQHFPDARRYDDVCTVGAHNLEPVDLICGGFPCQDLSYAGLGAGLEGERSGLWSEYARIVGELRPRYVVVENVSALLARGLGTVLADLAALGYDAEWDCLPASAVGAPHQRDRIWLVAYPDGSGRVARVADVHARQPDAQGCSERSGADPSCAGCDGGARSDAEQDTRGERSSGADPHGLRDVLADPDSGGRQGRTGEPGPARRHEPTDGGQVGDPEGDRRGSRGTGRPDPAGAREREPERSLQDPDSSALLAWRVGGRAAQAGGPEWWSVEPPVGRVAHGVPNRLDQLAALGNALVPQIAEWIGHRILEWEGGVTVP
jgi:DNA (cytosine-5)-methyltransferase 1